MAGSKTLAPWKFQLAPGQVPIRYRLLVSFSVPLAIWILVSILNVTVWRNAIDNAERLISSQRIILLANEYVGASLRTEAAKRGYLLSSDPLFLNTYNNATNTVNRVFDELSAQVRDQREQRERLQEAGNIFQEWLYDVSRRQIEARRALPFKIVVVSHELEKALLKLQDLHMRRVANANARHELLMEIRRCTHLLLEHETLAEQRAPMEKALGLLDHYETVHPDPEPSSEALRELTALLTRAIQVVLNRDAEITRGVMRDARNATLDEFHGIMGRFIASERLQLAGYREEMSASDQRGQLILWAGPALGLLLMLIMTNWMSRRIARSLDGITRAARGLARGDLRARAKVDGHDEFAVLAERFNVMADLVESRSRESAALAELGELLQSSTTIDEAARIFADLAAKLFPGQPGGLYLVAPSRDEVVALTFWTGGNDYSEAEFLPEDCWALRLSRPHENTADTAVRCSHLVTDNDTSLCVPLHAFGEMLGMLFVVNPQDGFAAGSINAEQHREFIDTVGEHLALAIANLRMRETLRHQSIRDPLTQLYNRRYLDETFRRELHRAGRRKTPLSVLTFDIDHFKRFNDMHGHDGGDELLKAVGNSLRDFFRAEDGAYRAGGEEFVAVLPETTLEDADSRAEELREEIAKLEVQHGNVVLPPVTISIGVAAFPQHGETVDQLLKAADRALYAAKKNGRNRVVAAG